jgi:hypothetical protein
VKRPTQPNNDNDNIFIQQQNLPNNIPTCQWRVELCNRTDMAGQDLRVHVKRNSKKKSGYEVEKRPDGYYYITAVPSAKSSVQPGDRVLEINGVKYTDFKTAEKANALFDMMVLDVVPGDDDDDDGDDDDDDDEWWILP